MTRFQLIFTSALVFFALVGAVLFAVARNENTGQSVQVTMWGSLPATQMSNFFSEVSLQSKVNVNYTEKNPASFESELIAALARGQGPDMVLLPQDLILKQADKFYVTPFENYSERLFKDSFIEGSELYLVPGGIMGFPFYVDPMVMYWNRDIFSNAGVSLPPTSWTELYTLAPKIIKKDANNNITQAMVAMGAMPNVSHAKDMVALLAIQAGTPIIKRDASGFLQSVFATQVQGPVPADQAVNFFTEFSNPVKPAYTWNRALANDRAMFLAGKLAMYFGYASELATIRAANPNLNFDVANVPQVAGKKATFGHMNAVAILKASPNLVAAFTAAVDMTSPTFASIWATTSGMPPVRRDLLASNPGDAYKVVFYQSALMSRAWLDPYREATRGVFTRLIEDVISGKYRTSESVRNASAELDALLRTQ